MTPTQTEQLERALKMAFADGSIGVDGDGLVVIETDATELCKFSHAIARHDEVDELTIPVRVTILNEGGQYSQLTNRLRAWHAAGQPA